MLSGINNVAKRTATACRLGMSTRKIAKKRIGRKMLRLVSCVSETGHLVFEYDHVLGDRGSR